MAEDFDPHETDIFAPQREAGYKHLQLDTAGGIARIVLNRPPANVLSVDVMADLNNALESLEYERAVKLVVLSASGKYFSAGFELNDHLGGAYLMLDGYRRIFENLAKLDKPTLAVVAGPALGAGNLLAAGCDMVLAAAQNAKFGHPEIKGGVFNTVAAALLPRLIGRRKAVEMIFSGQSLSAAEAERIGLITRAVPDDKLEAEAAALIQRFRVGAGGPDHAPRRLRRPRPAVRRRRAPRRGRLPESAHGHRGHGRGPARDHGEAPAWWKDR